jgi:hypothetical protein
MGVAAQGSCCKSNIWTFTSYESCFVKSEQHCAFVWRARLWRAAVHIADHALKWHDLAVYKYLASAMAGTVFQSGNPVLSIVSGFGACTIDFVRRNGAVDSGSNDLGGE